MFLTFHLTANSLYTVKDTTDLDSIFTFTMSYTSFYCHIQILDKHVLQNLTLLFQHARAHTHNR
jgi:hypothetical protein